MPLVGMRLSDGRGIGSMRSVQDFGIEFVCLGIISADQMHGVFVQAVDLWLPGKQAQALGHVLLKLRVHACLGPEEDYAALGDLMNFVRPKLNIYRLQELVGAKL